jgi:hypothetical protein
MEVDKDEYTLEITSDFEREAESGVGGERSKKASGRKSARKTHKDHRQLSFVTVGDGPSNIQID